MAACPNCGRQTLRTKDWACQWCGYPLISRAFKKIDKTFKELQEERNLALKSEEAGPEPELEVRPEPEPRPPPPVQPVSRPEPIARPQPAPKPAPAPEQPPRPPVQPVSRPEAILLPQPEIKPAPRPEPEIKPAPAPVQTPIISSQPPAPPAIEPPAPPPKPEIKLEPEPPPEPPIKLETIVDGMEITADQLDTLYRVEKAGAHAKFTGKTLVVKGLVEKVFVRDHLDIRYIVITGSRQKSVWSVRCTFGKESSLKLSRLNDGEQVAVRGKYDGYSKNIIFKDCVLV
jgi:hypothetical protein